MATSKLNFVASALIGTAVGTVAALLLAPSSGRSTRQSLRVRAGEIMAQMPFSLDDLRYKLGGPPRPRKMDASFIQLYREGGG